MKKLEKQYQNIYWDLDGTIWRHRGCEIEMICDKLNIKCDEKMKMDFLYMIEEYNRHFKSRKVTKNEAYKIIEKTMPGLFFTGISGKEFLECWNTISCNDLTLGAKNVLETLQKRGKQNIVLTDWWLERQVSQMKNFGILDYMEKVYSAEENFLKPNQLTVKRVIKPGTEESSIIVGDSIESDITFANIANIDCIWFNPDGKENETSLNVTYEITSLEQVVDIIK